VPARNRAFYWHVIAAYAITFVAMHYQRKLYLAFVRLRHLHLLSRTPQQHTVMLHHIPKQLQSATAMYHFFNTMFPGQVASIGIILRIPKLSGLLTRYQRAVHNLEKNLSLAIAAAKQGSGKRPKILRRMRNGHVGEPVGWAWGWSSGLGWPFIRLVEDDAINYWHRETQRLRRRVNVRREECAAWHAQFERKQAETIDAGAFKTMDLPGSHHPPGSHDYPGAGEVKESAESVLHEGESKGANDEPKQSDADSRSERRARFSSATSGDGMQRTPARGYSDLEIVQDHGALGLLSYSMPSYMRMALAAEDPDQELKAQHFMGKSHDGAWPSDQDDGDAESDMPSVASRRSEEDSYVELARRKCFGDKKDGASGPMSERNFPDVLERGHLPSLAERPDDEDECKSWGPSCGWCQWTKDEEDEEDADPDQPSLPGWQKEWFQKASASAIQSAVAKTWHFVLGSPLSSTAFVTFYTLRAASIVRTYNGALHPTPSAMISSSSGQKADWSLADADAASYTPEPRDIFWKNVCETWQKRPIQGFAGSVFSVFIILTFTVPVATVSGFANVSSLREKWPFVDRLVSESPLIENMLALLSPLLLMWLINLVPPVLAVFQRFVSNEARSMSENQALVFRRFFSFLFYNAFILLSVATSAQETAFEAAQDPRKGLTNLGIALPKSSAFYVQFIMIRTFAGLGFEIARINPFLLACVKFLLSGTDMTPQQRENPVLGCRSFDRPGPLYYGRAYADALLVFLFSIAYCVVAPLVVPFGAMYFAGAYIVFKRQLAYVYEKEYETGGALWPGVQRRIFLSIIASHVVLACVLGAKVAWTEFGLLFPLPFITMIWQQFMTRIYGSASRSLPLSVAANEDRATEDRLAQAHESFMHSDEFSEIRDAYTQPELKQELALVDAELLDAAFQLGIEMNFDESGGAPTGDGVGGSFTAVPPQPMRRRPTHEEERLLV